MKYVLVLALGILTGLAFNHLPTLQPFRNETPPATPGDWNPKMTGNWSEGDRATINRWFNGGVA